MSEYEDDDHFRLTAADIVPFPRRAEDDQPKAAPIITATPYLWTDPEKIPLRDWLYGRLLVRRFLSLTIAPGGVGKSSLTAAEALALVSGRDLLGVLPDRRMKVWLWNLEDPVEETTRKIQAAAKRYHLTQADLDDHLFVNSGRDHSLVIAKEHRGSTMILRPVIDAIVAEIKRHEIDVLIIDPFVSCHEVRENDNSAIDMISKEWSRVAEIGNCAVHLIHHTRKAPSGTEVTTESSRGAKALSDASRVARALNQMTEKEGETAGVENFRLYFRTYNDKANLAPPVVSSDWYRIASVSLDNGPAGGDSVGVVTRWEWPDAFAGVTGGDFMRVAVAIKGGTWRENARSNEWVGIAVAKTLGLSAGDKQDRAKINALLKAWFGSGSLVVVERLDETRRKRKFVEVPDED